MHRYLVHFAHSHLDFRVPELQSVAKGLRHRLEIAEKCTQESPFLVVEAESDSSASQVAGRSILVKNISRVWCEAPCLDLLLEQVEAAASTLFASLSGSFKILFRSFGSCIQRSQEETVGIYDRFASVIPGLGKVSLQQPDFTFLISEDHARSRFLFSQFVADGNRRLIARYNVKEREYIGTTSMDAELSLIMANMAAIRPQRSLIWDPFVGTGSLLLACADRGAFTIGSEIDRRQLTGGVTFDGGRQIKKSCNWQTNVQQYGLQSKVLDALIFDVSCPPLIRGVEFLDAIVTDPPYGIRAGAKQTGDKIQVSGMDDAVVSLLEFAAKYLTIGGRLVFWHPIIEEEDIKLLPSHPSLQTLYQSQQMCGGWSRLLVTMEKITANSHEPPAYIEKSGTFRKRLFDKLGKNNQHL